MYHYNSLDSNFSTIVLFLYSPFNTNNISRIYYKPDTTALLKLYAGLQDKLQIQIQKKLVAT